MQERVTQIPPGGYHAKNENGEIGYPCNYFLWISMTFYAYGEMALAPRN